MLSLEIKLRSWQSSIMGFLKQKIKRTKPATLEKLSKEFESSISRTQCKLQEHTIALKRFPRKSTGIKNQKYFWYTIIQILIQNLQGAEAKLGTF